MIVDDLSAHKTNQVQEFLKRNPNAMLHFTESSHANELAATGY
jgi:hypothetical protein